MRQFDQQKICSQKWRGLYYLFCFIVSSPLLAGDWTTFLNERLEYDMIYQGLNSVESHMWVEREDSSTFKIIWTAKTRPLYSLLFNIDNRYETLFHAVSQQLIETRKDVRQKNIQQNWRTTYQWDTLLAVTGKGWSWPAVGQSQNVLWMLYDLRLKSLAANDTVSYILDVESQIWQVKGVVKPASNSDIHELSILFSFSPVRPIVARKWKTDILTNRLARENASLYIQLGPPPDRVPLLIRFGTKDESVEMKLENRTVGQ